MKNKALIDLLPNKSESANTTFELLYDFAEAINQKYKKELTANITESTFFEDEKKKSFLTYAFYLNAPLGRGYFYRLFAVDCSPENVYPAKITLFLQEPTEIGTAKNSDEFNELILSVFKNDEVQRMMQNILALVEKHNKNLT